MKHEKTFEAIAKLKDIEIELHRLKNALEMANKALDAKREWVGLTDEDVYPLANKYLHYQIEDYLSSGVYNLARAIEAKIKHKNT